MKAEPLQQPLKQSLKEPPKPAPIINTINKAPPIINTQPFASVNQNLAMSEIISPILANDSDVNFEETISPQKESTHNILLSNSAITNR